MLPDVALLEIFDFYVDGARTEAWHTLVHVCRNWRNVIFRSPQRLNLRLRCIARTPVRERIETWPLLPIIVHGYDHQEWGMDNIIAALEHNDRICQLELNFPSSETSSQVEIVLAAMQQPFLALEVLRLYSMIEKVVAPASFLGGSAPQLRSLDLSSIPFPGLPKLLLSATHLVTLLLYDIPHSGYFSPEAMITGLAVLTRLEKLLIKFISPQSRPDRRRRPPPLTRTLLPALTNFEFKGVSEYLDGLVARIDAPLLDELYITFFHQLIFDTTQLIRFISRTPKFKACDDALVQFFDRSVRVSTIDKALKLAVSCRPSDWQLSFLAQVCGSIFIPAIEHLYIREGTRSSLSWQDDIETGQWLELLNRLPALKDLRISRDFMPRIAPTLQELVGERVTEVLPALQTLFLEEALPSGPVQESIGKFLAARQLAGHSVTISLSERERFR